MAIVLDKIVPAFTGGLYTENAVWGQRLTLQPGQLYLVSAHSGKGKSTLVSYLYGLRNDFSGSISIDGDNIAGFRADRWALCRRNKLAIVFQDMRLFGHLTARENIDLKKQLSPAYPADVEDMSAMLSISDLLDRPASKLSMGQQQRVAIVRALCQPFEWLLLDEPFSHLDAENTEKAMALIMREASKNKAGVILTTLGNEQINQEGIKLTL